MSYSIVQALISHPGHYSDSRQYLRQRDQIYNRRPAFCYVILLTSHCNFCQSQDRKKRHLPEHTSDFQDTEHLHMLFSMIWMPSKINIYSSFRSQLKQHSLWISKWRWSFTSCSSIYLTPFSIIGHWFPSFVQSYFLSLWHRLLY